MDAEGKITGTETGPGSAPGDLSGGLVGGLGGLGGGGSALTGAAAQAVAWQALELHAEVIGGAHLRELFAADPSRGERLSAEAAGLYLDYSKNRVTDETLGLLIELARTHGLEPRRDEMMRGDRINRTEDRSVLHVALRMPRERSHSTWIAWKTTRLPGTRGSAVGTWRTGWRGS